MERNEIKEANRKAMPGFLLLALVGALVGGIVGFYSAEYDVEQSAGYSRHHTDSGHTCLSKDKKAAFGMGWRG